MFKGKHINKQSVVVAESDAGPVLEISFIGKHWDGCGNELIAYVRQSVEEIDPAGVIMNLSNFSYVWGNDIGALLFPLFERQTAKRLFCIVARGTTARSLKSLFELTRLPDIVNVKYFDDARDGLIYLRKELGGDTV